jgi:hypothetical protein
MWVRRQARQWIHELDQIDDDWEREDLLWADIALWLKAHPSHCREFLSLFRRSRALKRVPPSLPGYPSASIFAKIDLASTLGRDSKDTE